MTNIVHQNLAKTCVLVSVSLSRWQGKKIDVNASSELAERKNAKSGSAYVTKRLVSDQHCPSFKAIAKIDGHIRNNLVYRRALPTPVKNVRLVTASSLSKLIPELDAAFEEREALVDELVDKEYPAFLSLAQSYLGDLFDEDEFPTPTQVRAHYKAAKVFRPLADADPSIVGFPDEVAEMISQEAAKSHDHLREIAQGALGPRLHEALSAFVVAMREYAVSTKTVRREYTTKKGEQRSSATQQNVRHNPFRDSKVFNVWEAAEDCIDLDLSVGQGLAAFGKKVYDKFRPIDPEYLREVPTSVREKYAYETEELIREMQDAGLTGSDAKRATKFGDIADVETPEVEDMLDGVVALGF